MSFDWSPYLVSGESEFPPTFKFTEAGDNVSGVISGIREHEQDGKKTAIVEIDEKHTVWVSQVDLRAKVAAANPQVNDEIDITFVRTVPVKGGKTMKEFAVKVDRTDTEPF